MKLYAACRHPVDERYDFCFECWLLNTCMSSRVPRYVRDPAVIAQVVALLAAGPTTPQGPPPK